MTMIDPAVPSEQRLRVLLPAKPTDQLSGARCLLKELLPPSRVQVRRLYVHRPLRADFYIPDGYARSREIAELEFDAENATRVASEHDLKPFAEDGFEVSAEVLRGSPVEVILREAEFWRPNLVAVRTRSVEAQDRKIGGVASALLHHGTCGILVFRDIPSDYRIWRILIPTDFSESARQSTEWGLAVAKSTGGRAVLLHVIAQWYNRHAIDQDDLLEMATEGLERWKSGVNPALQDSVETQVVTAGNPAAGIIGFARERGCDLIVLSAKGVSAVQAVLLGSTTRKVVRAAECPVLVIPTGMRESLEEFLAKATRSEAPRAADAGGLAAARSASPPSPPVS